MTLEQIKKKRTFFETISGIGVVATILFSLAMVHNTLFMLLVFLSVGVTAYGFSGLQKLSTLFKAEHLKKVIEEKFEGCIFTPDKGLEKDLVINSKIVKGSSIYKSEDYLEGTFEGIKFVSADVHIQERRSTGKGSYTVTMFQGRFYIIEFDKKFNEDVYILPTPNLLFAPFSDLKKVALESIEFNKAFDVFSKDPHAVFYLLTPRFMEKIKSFSEKYDKVTYAFRNEMVYVAVDNRVDSFDFKYADELENFYIDHIDRELKMLKDLSELIRKTSST